MLYLKANAHVFPCRAPRHLHPGPISIRASGRPGLQADAMRLLDRLNRTDPCAPIPQSPGEQPGAARRTLRECSQAEWRGLFGSDFAESLVTQPVGKWLGRFPLDTACTWCASKRSRAGGTPRARRRSAAGGTRVGERQATGRSPRPSTKLCAPGNAIKVRCPRPPSHEARNASAVALIATIAALAAAAADGTRVAARLSRVEGDCARQLRRALEAALAGQPGRGMPIVRSFRNTSHWRGASERARHRRGSSPPAWNAGTA